MGIEELEPVSESSVDEAVLSGISEQVKETLFPIEECINRIVLNNRVPAIWNQVLSIPGLEERGMRRLIREGGLLEFPDNGHSPDCRERYYGELFTTFSLVRGDQKFFHCFWKEFLDSMPGGDLEALKVGIELKKMVPNSDLRVSFWRYLWDVDESGVLLDSFTEVEERERFMLSQFSSKQRLDLSAGGDPSLLFEAVLEKIDIWDRESLKLSAYQLIILKDLPEDRKELLRERIESVFCETDLKKLLKCMTYRKSSAEFDRNLLVVTLNFLACFYEVPSELFIELELDTQFNQLEEALGQYAGFDENSVDDEGELLIEIEQDLKINWCSKNIISYIDEQSDMSRGHLFRGGLNRSFLLHYVHDDVIDSLFSLCPDQELRWTCLGDSDQERLEFLRPFCSTCLEYFIAQRHQSMDLVKSNTLHLFSESVWLKVLDANFGSTFSLEYLPLFCSEHPATISFFESKIEKGEITHLESKLNLSIIEVRDRIQVLPFSDRSKILLLSHFLKLKGEVIPDIPFDNFDQFQVSLSDMTSMNSLGASEMLDDYQSFGLSEDQVFETFLNTAETGMFHSASRLKSFGLSDESVDKVLAKYLSNELDLFIDPEEVTGTLVNFLGSHSRLLELIDPEKEGLEIYGLSPDQQEEVWLGQARVDPSSLYKWKSRIDLSSESFPRILQEMAFHIPLVPGVFNAFYNFYNNQYENQYRDKIVPVAKILRERNGYFRVQRDPELLRTAPEDYAINCAYKEFDPSVHDIREDEVWNPVKALQTPGVDTDLFLYGENTKVSRNIVRESVQNCLKFSSRMLEVFEVGKSKIEGLFRSENVRMRLLREAVLSHGFKDEKDFLSLHDSPISDEYSRSKSEVFFRSNEDGACGLREFMFDGSDQESLKRGESGFLSSFSGWSSYLENVQLDSVLSEALKNDRTESAISEVRSLLNLYITELREVARVTGDKDIYEKYRIELSSFSVEKMKDLIQEMRKIPGKKIAETQWRLVGSICGVQEETWSALEFTTKRGASQMREIGLLALQWQEKYPLEGGMLAGFELDIETVESSPGEHKREGEKKLSEVRKALLEYSKLWYKFASLQKTLNPSYKNEELIQRIEKYRSVVRPFSVASFEKVKEEMKTNITECFRSFLSIENEEIGYEAFQTLEKKWRSLDTPITLASRMQSYPKTIESISWIMEACLQGDKSFLDLKYGGRFDDEVDQELAKKSLAMCSEKQRKIWTEENPVTLVSGSEFSETEAEKNERVSKEILNKQQDFFTLHLPESLRPSTPLKEGFSFLRDAHSNFSKLEQEMHDQNWGSVQKLIKDVSILMEKTGNILIQEGFMSQDQFTQIKQDLPALGNLVDSFLAPVEEIGSDSLYVSVITDDPKMMLESGMFADPSSCQNSEIGAYAYCVPGYVMEAYIKGVFTWELKPVDMKADEWQLVHDQIASGVSLDLSFDPHERVMKILLSDKTIRVPLIRDGCRAILKAGRTESETMGTGIEPFFTSSKFGHEGMLQSATDRAHQLYQDQLECERGGLLSFEDPRIGLVYSDRGTGIENEAHMIKFPS